MDVRRGRGVGGALSAFANLACPTTSANYLSHGGSIETAARIAGHASTSTTQLYDRRSDTVNQSEIERIRF